MGRKRQDETKGIRVQEDGVKYPYVQDLENTIFFQPRITEALLEEPHAAHEAYSLPTYYFHAYSDFAHSFPAPRTVQAANVACSAVQSFSHHGSCMPPVGWGLPPQ